MLHINELQRLKVMLAIQLPPVLKLVCRQVKLFFPFLYYR